MYISKWVFKNDEEFHETTISLKKNLTPFIIIRVIPRRFIKDYHIVVRDYNTGILLNEKELKKSNYSIYKAKIIVEKLAFNIIKKNLN